MLVYLSFAVLVICFGFVVVRGAPYVPSHRRQVERALTELYTLSDNDMLVDLGSGDGSVLRAARRYGARAIGYEINPVLVAISRILSWRDHNVQIRLSDYQLIDQLPQEATVVYVFTTRHSIETIGRKMQQWSQDRELYLISYGFCLSHRRPVRQRGPMYLYHFYRSHA